MSDLEIYFPAEDKIEIKIDIDKEWMYLVIGVIIGIVLTTFVFLIKRKWFKEEPHLEFINRK